MGEGVPEGGRYGRRRWRKEDGSCRSGLGEGPPVLEWMSGMEGRRLLLLPILVGLIGKTRMNTTDTFTWWLVRQV